MASSTAHFYGHVKTAEYIPMASLSSLYVKNIQIIMLCPSAIAYMPANHYVIPIQPSRLLEIMLLWKNS